MKKILVGAIRWDAWVGDNHPVGLEVEKTLSNPEYYNRLPFYTSYKDGKPLIRCTNKDIILKEIDYASNYGIDYFAFCWYPHNSNLDIARKIFLSIKQDKIKWCLILGTNPFTCRDAKWLIEEFKKDNYLKIDNRPIIYLFNMNDELLKIVNYLRKYTNPYIIGLVWNYEEAINFSELFNLDALSQYCTPGQNNLSYVRVSKKEREAWNKYKQIKPVIPWVSTGWDKRPRYDSPVSWEECDNFNKEYIEFPNLKELEEEVTYAYHFASNNNSNLILIYAWNEFDEGGFIAPTLNNGKIDTSKLEAIKKAIDKNSNM